MNRILKKAISFFSAVAIGISTLAAGAVTAQAASSVTVKTALSAKYEAVVLGWDSALFVSDVEKDDDGDLSIPKDAAMVMVTDQGKKVKLKNTTGFDKIYVIGTMYGSYVVGNNFETSTFSVKLQKGNKYTMLRSDGTYLAKGKLFDEISYDGTTAILGKTHYYYGDDGKLIGKFNSSTKMEVVAYDKSTKTYVTKDMDCGWNGFNLYFVRNNKIIKTINDCYPSSGLLFTVKGKGYIHVYNNDGEQCYTLSGKKTTKVSREDSDQTEYAAKPESSLELVRDYENNKIILKDRKTGKTVKSYKFNDSSSYFYFSSIKTLSNGKSFFITTNKSQTKFGCITF